jgi:murein DD-endopeptidase MepM/ murein hydrolase activator NlpD
MHKRAFGILFVASLAVANAAFACEPTPDSSGPWLASNKPVLGQDVKLKAPFGIVFRPFLNGKRMHTGVDWAADRGTPVVAAASGEVVEARRRGAYGNTILIDHGGGYQTLYAHLLEFSVSPGDCVEFGTIIGKVGSTGLVAGPLLHFEVHENGQPVDPLAVPVRQQARK